MKPATTLESLASSSPTTSSSSTVTPDKISSPILNNIPQNHNKNATNRSLPAQIQLQTKNTTQLDNHVSVAAAVAAVSLSRIKSNNFISDQTHHSNSTSHSSSLSVSPAKSPLGLDYSSSSEDESNRSFKSATKRATLQGRKRTSIEQSIRRKGSIDIYNSTDKMQQSRDSLNYAPLESSSVPPNYFEPTASFPANSNEESSFNSNNNTVMHPLYIKSKSSRLSDANSVQNSTDSLVQRNAPEMRGSSMTGSRSSIISQTALSTKIIGSSGSGGGGKLGATTLRARKSRSRLHAPSSLQISSLYSSTNSSLAASATSLHNINFGVANHGMFGGTGNIIDLNVQAAIQKLNDFENNLENANSGDGGHDIQSNSLGKRYIEFRKSLRLFLNNMIVCRKYHY